MKDSLLEQVVKGKITDNPDDVYTNYSRDYKSIGVKGSNRLVITEKTSDSNPAERYFVDDDKKGKYYVVVDGKLVETDAMYSERGKGLGPFATLRVLARVAFGEPFQPKEVPIDLRKYYSEHPNAKPTTMSSAIGFSGGRMPTAVMTGGRGTPHGTRLDPR